MNDPVPCDECQAIRRELAEAYALAGLVHPAHAAVACARGGLHFLFLDVGD